MITRYGYDYASVDAAERIRAFGTYIVARGQQESVGTWAGDALHASGNRAAHQWLPIFGLEGRGTADPALLLEVTL